MGKVEHSVRWRTRDGFRGWGYEPAKGGVWGFQDVQDPDGAMDVIRAIDSSENKDGEPVVEQVCAFVAPDGLVHRNMRDLFAVFRLRMFEPDPTEPLELLRRLLRIVQSERACLASWEALAERAFDGSVAFAKAYVHWLDAERLVVRMSPAAHHLAPSDEGAAVLRMLDLTASDSEHLTDARSVFFRKHRQSTVARVRGAKALDA